MGKVQAVREHRYPGSILESLYYSNLVIPLVAAGLTLATFVMMGVDPDGWVLVLAMTGAYLIYVVERAWLTGPEDVHNHPERIEWLSRHRTSMSAATIAVSLLHAIALAQLVSIGSIYVVITLALIASVYCLPILPGGERLKSVWFLKPIVIAAAWSVGTVLLPVTVVGYKVDATIWALALYRFIFLLPNTLLADVPDARGDSRAGLSTIASRFASEIGVVAQVIAAALPLIAFVIWTQADIPSFLLADSLVGPLFLVAYRAARGRENDVPRIFYDLHMDVIVAAPLLGAILYSVITAHA